MEFTLICAFDEMISLLMANISSVHTNIESIIMCKSCQNMKNNKPATLLVSNLSFMLFMIVIKLYFRSNHYQSL